MASVLLEYDIEESPERFKVSHLYNLASLTALKLLTMSNHVNYGIGTVEKVKEDIVDLNGRISKVLDKMRASL